MAWYDFLTGAIQYVTPDSLEEWARGGYEWLTKPRGAAPSASPDWADLDKSVGAPPAEPASYLNRAVESAFSGVGDVLGDIRITSPRPMEAEEVSMSMGEEEPIMETPLLYRPVKFTPETARRPPQEPPYRPLTEMPVAERTQQQMIERAKVLPFDEEREGGGTRVYPGKGILVGGEWYPTTMEKKRQNV